MPKIKVENLLWVVCCDVKPIKGIILQRAFLNKDKELAESYLVRVQEKNPTWGFKIKTVVLEYYKEAT